MTGGNVIRARPLTAKAYRPYGDMIGVFPGLKSADANRRTARRFDHAAEARNLRPDTAEPNLCLFRCRPRARPPLLVRTLERHPYSTQAFLPLGGPKRFLVVVCAGSDRPDPRTLRAFLARGTQGITYRPGVWHHPMVALDRTTDFACLVWEDGSSGDCQESSLEGDVRVQWST